MPFFLPPLAMNFFGLSLRMFLRHLRAGELSLLGLALVLAVASLTSVGFLGDRIARALEREANQLLGGDLLLVADHPWAPSFALEARRRGLSVVASELFVSMAGKDSALQMAGVKAVEPGYPLRGALRIAAAPGAPDSAAAGVPRPGTVWLDERLAAALSAGPGETVALGAGRFTVGAILTFEADRGGNFLSFLPRLLMNQEDLPATGLVREGSRVTWRLHFAGDAEAVARFQSWAGARLGRGEQLEDVAHARPELRTALERAERYLRLSALLAVVLAAVAVGLAARRFMERNLDGCAVMRCLGAKQGRVSGLFLAEFLLFGTLASAAGCGLGYAAQKLLEILLSGLVSLPLPAPSFLPAFQGLMVGLALVLGFAAPWLLRLSRVSPLRVMRREWQPARPGTFATWGAGLAVLAGLMFWIAGEVKLGALVCAGFAAALGLYALLAWALLDLLAKLAGRLGSGLGGWRLGLAALRRHRVGMLIQTLALALGLTALLLLALARDDLVAAWKNSVPPDAPNRFVLNIQPDERQAVGDFFAARGRSVPDLLPMVRGRLFAVNDRPVQAADYPEERARRLAEREFNLSWATALPQGNTVSAGRWFDPGQGRAGGFSVEEGLAKTLGLTLGDRLAFDIAGSRVEGAITSLRRLEWDSMRVNFFVIAPPALLGEHPASYIASFHLPPAQAEFGRQLLAAFPALTLIDVSALLGQLQDMLGQLSRAVQFVFLFALGAGLLVLFAALEASLDERAEETAILRALGARNRTLRQALVAEFAALGLVSGLLAATGAAALAWSLGHFVFKLPYVPNPVFLGTTILAASLATPVFALWGLGRTLRMPVMAALRAGE
ncbi:MAG: FtsX-like permease family protein [Rhodocyclaceae bacterium]|nr:FtsX-like permease family protein [Rhodocyclaceae bacterium]